MFLGKEDYWQSIHFGVFLGIEKARIIIWHARTFHWAMFLGKVGIRGMHMQNLSEYPGYHTSPK